MTDKLKNLLNGQVDNETEPLLRKQLGDFMPDEDGKMNEDFKRIYHEMCKLIWFSDEVDTVQDQIDIKTKMHPKEIRAINFVIKFFANADSIVADNINFNLGAAVQPFYCKAGYRFIDAMEDIHAETYMKIMKSIFPNEIETIKKEIVNISSIRKKIEFMAKWMSDDCSFHERVLAFLCVEAIMFSASFAIIFYFKTKMLLPGIISANELIARDEGLHQDYGVLVHKYIVKKESEERIHEIIKEAVGIEENFIDDALPEQINDLSAWRIKTYVQYVADRLSMQLGCKKIYNVDNPCNYMVGLGVETKQNFFEVKATSYLTPSPDKSLKEVEF